MKSYLVKSCQNGVKRCGNRRRLPATRSTYTSNKTYCVKGHRAGRLFNHNNKVIERRFQNEHSLPNSSDEQLVSQALSEHKQLQEEIKAKAQKDLEESNQIGEGPYKKAHVAYLKRQIAHPATYANYELQLRYPSVAKEITERRKKRNEFLRRTENKICYVCGAKGHVSKDCTSQIKYEKREKRTIAYKKRLGEKGLYKVDVDAAYKKIQTELDSLKIQNARLMSINTSLKHELEAVTSMLHQVKVGGKDTCPAQECEKIVHNNPEPIVKADIAIQQVTGGLKCSDKQGCKTGKSNYSLGSAQRALCITGMCAAVVVITMLVVMLSGSTPIYSEHKINTYSMNMTVPISQYVSTVTKQVWKIIYVAKCLINLFFYILSCISITKLTLVGLVMILIRMFMRRVNKKVNGMLEWDAMDMYRKTLKQSGYTSRLPYKVSQIGSSECPGTKLEAYKLCYTAVIRALTPITVVCKLAKAIILVIKNIFGLIELTYKRSRGLFKRFARFLANTVRYIFCFMLGIVAMIVMLLFTILRVAATIVLSKKFASLALVAIIVYLAKVYVVGHIIVKILQFSEICELLRAKLVHYAGMMTLNPIRLVQLITVKYPYIKVHDIIDILVKKIGYLLKFK